MEGYPKSKKVLIKEDYEDTRLELRLCPPGDGFYPPKTLVEKRVSQPQAVVGWPPVRTSRKNIMTSSNSTKVVYSPEKSPAAGSDGKKTCSDHENSLYVKINMDGVAIGRKVDLKAYDDYQKLSTGVDELFTGLVAAQADASSNVMNKQTTATTGLLNGNGEYTLVYEDNEGDKILVGDVPWDMFIASAKRLRVLKRSELTFFCSKSN